MWRVPFPISAPPGSSGRALPQLGARAGSPAGAGKGTLKRWSGRSESLWLTRMRWRMRGAWLWPSFIVLTRRRGRRARGPADRRRRPRRGRPGRAARGLREPDRASRRSRRSAARRLRRRRPDLPRVVAENYAGTALLCAIAVAILALGLVHRPSVLAAEDDLRAQAAAVHDYVAAQAPRVPRRDRARRPDAARGGPLPHLRPGPGPEALAVPVRQHRAAPGGRDARPRPRAEHRLPPTEDSSRCRTRPSTSSACTTRSTARARRWCCCTAPT